MLLHFLIPVYGFECTYETLGQRKKFAIASPQRDFAIAKMDELHAKMRKSVVENILIFEGGLGTFPTAESFRNYTKDYFYHDVVYNWEDGSTIEKLIIQHVQNCPVCGKKLTSGVCC